MSSSSARRLVGGLALVTAVSTAGVVATSTATFAAPSTGSPTDGLGGNVLVFDPSMPVSDIQATVDAVYNQQVANQFGTQRYALLFKPGTYGDSSHPLDVKVGYYTEVAGLGQDPTDVTINGGVTTVNQCDSTGCVALNNFWRSVANLTIDPVATADGCHTGNEMWAASQAAPMRRVEVNGATTFMDYCTGPSYASGGFVSDSVFNGIVINGSQQQYYVRDSELNGGWSNAVWNQVFSGTTGAPAQSFPNPPYTTLATTPVSKERPYLYVDDAGAWDVFVPSPRVNSSGTTWAGGHTQGRSIPLSDFFVAKPGDSVDAINAALSNGKNLLLTPGVYDVAKTIKVKRPDSVVLGLGFATLTAENGVTALSTADVAGIDLAGITVDAGPLESDTLMQIGSKNGNNGVPHNDASNPVALQDVFFRIGGPHLGKTKVALEVNTDNALLDDIWSWRADHGAGVGWTQNTAHTGLVVNGDNVTATGLFVEHYQNYNVIWNGNGGTTVFFQNELPYDAPNQDAYRHGDVLGWAAYKIADTVTTHQLWGAGSYVYTPVDPGLHISHSYEVPVTPGVQLHDILTLNLSGPGTIDHVVNDVGGSASAANADQIVPVVSFP